MRHHYEQHVEEESGKMGKGKRVRRQVQYFQPGQDIEASNFDGDEEYQGDDGPAGSDNEYQGATHFYNLRISPGLCGRFKVSDRVRYSVISNTAIVIK